MNDNYCRTKSCYGPRGDYYEWCRYLPENDTLVFGEEEGNYAGGITLSYRWYGSHRDKMLPEDHVPTEEYWRDVQKVIESLKSKEPEFYKEIIKMLERNNSKCLSKLEV